MTQQETGLRDEERDRPRFEPGVPLANREWRPAHLTHTTRELLARFFRVYPGFLVDDPEGYTPGLQSELRAIDAKIDSWLFAGAEQFAPDPALQRALLVIAEHEDSRRAILLLAEILVRPN